MSQTILKTIPRRIPLARMETKSAVGYKQSWRQLEELGQQLRRLWKSIKNTLQILKEERRV